jgi:hypothetical protein
MPPIGPSFSGSPYGSTAAAHQQSVDPSTVTGPPGLAESPFPAPVAALGAPPFHDERQSTRVAVSSKSLAAAAICLRFQCGKTICADRAHRPISSAIRYADSVSM